MITIVAGSRYGVTPLHVEVAMITCPWWPSEVVCGEARGSDRFGKEWAQARGIPVKSFPARWETPWGKDRDAGHKRNTDMADYAQALVLIWDGISNGSFDMLKKARARNLQVHLLYTQ